MPKKLVAWAQQPGSKLMQTEASFVESVHHYASAGVGYGFMQQVIEWIWQEKAEADGLPGGAWGPEYFRARIKALEDQLAVRRKT